MISKIKCALAALSDSTCCPLKLPLFICTWGCFEPSGGKAVEQKHSDEGMYMMCHTQTSQLVINILGTGETSIDCLILYFLLASLLPHTTSSCALICINTSSLRNERLKNYSWGKATFTLWCEEDFVLNSLILLNMQKHLARRSGSHM